MTVARWCVKCQKYYNININEFLLSSKRRVVCGICGTQLMSRSEAHNIFYYPWA
jgi:hypothetical protein